MPQHRDYDYYWTCSVCGLALKQKSRMDDHYTDEHPPIRKIVWYNDDMKKEYEGLSAHFRKLLEERVTFSSPS